MGGDSADGGKRQEGLRGQRKEFLPFSETQVFLKEEEKKVSFQKD